MTTKAKGSGKAKGAKGAAKPKGGAKKGEKPKKAAKSGKVNLAAVPKAVVKAPATPELPPGTKVKDIAGPSEEGQRAGEIPGAKSKGGIDPAGQVIYNPPPRPGSSGNTANTSETRILACQCGSTRFDVKKRTRTAISLVCSKCGLRASVKGNVATVRIRQTEITYALEHTVVTPDDSPPNDGDGDDSGGKVGDGAGGLGAEYTTLRFRVMKGDQLDVIERAMEAARVANCADDKFREQTWQGHTLEFICADFLSGCTHDVLQIVDAMDAAQEDALRIANVDGKAEPNARKLRELRAKVRDKLAVESGLLPVEKLSEDTRQLDLPDGTQENDSEDEGDDDKDEGAEAEDEADTETDADDEREEQEASVPDGGRLEKAVRATLEGYYGDAVSANVEKDHLPESVVEDGPTPSSLLIKRWTKSGGYLVRILGDKRTFDAKGERASVCAWISAEPPDVVLDFDIEYDDATDEILGDGVVEVVELLPPDYKEIEQWDQPHFVDRRETL